ncbi:MAG: hypothetical protein ACRDVM_03630 [Acidimicrobiia bacterium]
MADQHLYQRLAEWQLFSHPGDYVNPFGGREVWPAGPIAFLGRRLPGPTGPG